MAHNANPNLQSTAARSLLSAALEASQSITIAPGIDPCLPDYITSSEVGSREPTEPMLSSEVLHMISVELRERRRISSNRASTSFAFALLSGSIFLGAILALLMLPAVGVSTLAPGAIGAAASALSSAAFFRIYINESRIDAEITKDLHEIFRAQVDIATSKQSHATHTRRSRLVERLNSPLQRNADSTNEPKDGR